MARPRVYGERTTITLRMPTELALRLRASCDDLDRHHCDVLNELAEGFVERHEQRQRAREAPLSWEK